VRRESFNDRKNFGELKGSEEGKKNQTLDRGV